MENVEIGKRYFTAQYFGVKALEYDDKTEYVKILYYDLNGQGWITWTHKDRLTDL